MMRAGFLLASGNMTCSAPTLSIRATFGPPAEATSARPPAWTIARATSIVPRSTPPFPMAGSTCRIVAPGGKRAVASSAGTVLDWSGIMSSAAHSAILDRPMNRQPDFLDRDGVPIAFHYTAPRGAGARLPGVVFLGGFMSDMEGGKALHLEATCKERGQQYTRLDYRGHGQSGGVFAEACLSDWAGDAAAVIGARTTGPHVLVGSSMGGWIMLLLAKMLPERVRGLVGIAPAPDFVLRMEESLSAEQHAELAAQGHTGRPTPYADDPQIITKRLLDDGKNNLVLSGDGHPFTGPVRILHGLEDDAVPWKDSLVLAEKLASTDVRITYVKGGDHRLSEPDQLAMLDAAVLEVSRLVA